MRLTVQLYTVRDPLSADFGGTLRKLREIGLEYVEFAGNYGESIASTRDLLQELGLKPSGAHVGLDAIESNFEEVVARHRELGCNALIVPHVGPSFYADGWDKLGERLAKVGAKLRAEGFHLGYHNHDFEFVDFHGQPGLDALYAAAPATDLVCQLDLAWVKIGGQNPADYVRKYGARVKHVHLKDFDPNASPRWRPAGQGVMDFDAVLAATKDAETEFGSIELDESPGDSLEAVKASFDYFKQKGLN